MNDVMRKSILLISIIASGLCIALFAINVTQLWIIWLLTAGFFAGSALAPRMTTLATSLCALSVLAISGTLIARRLPIYALDWTDTDRVEISALGENWKIVVSDPQEVAALMKYGESGHYATILKSGTLIHLYVIRGGTSTGYYIHGDSVGPLPGGSVQTVFVPERDGLLTDLRGLLARHGHTELLP